MTLFVDMGSALRRGAWGFFHAMAVRFDPGLDLQRVEEYLRRLAGDPGDFFEWLTELSRPA